MRFVLYGMPCAGKTTVLQALGDKLEIINGSDWLNRYAGGRFSDLTKEQKKEARIKYTEYLASLKEDILSDGHYAFEEEVVFTPADGEIYDVFLYLYCEPELLWSRMQDSDKNRRFSALSVENLSRWQSFEIENLRRECHSRKKDFYVIPWEKNCTAYMREFIMHIRQGFSACKMGEEICDKIRTWYPTPCALNIVDGDKTYLKQDSFRVCSDDAKTTIFDGDFYTGYQSWLFERETAGLSYHYEKLGQCSVNELLTERLDLEKSVILSSGVTSIWKRISELHKIPHVIASPLISADTKYYTVRLLMEYGYEITAFGDSKTDVYMLLAAKKGCFCIGDRLSGSVKNFDLSGIELLYEKTPYILSEDETYSIQSLTDICKSNSGISGNRLAAAHFALGQTLGLEIRKKFPNVNTAVLVLERGGRFFGDGLYTSFGGRFYPVNPKSGEFPNVNCERVVIVDSVINTGNSILETIGKLEQEIPSVNICIATNVIQKEAIQKLKAYKIFAIRVSENKFVGAKLSRQNGNKGPDTADRLYNLI